MEKNYEMINFVAEIRISRGLTQSELAKKIGVSRNTISSIETGQYNPTAYTAGLLCKALDVKFEDMFRFFEIKDFVRKGRVMKCMVFQKM